MVNTVFTTKDSGAREVFPSGMTRDTEAGKPRYDLVDPVMLKRWAELMGRGAVKYGANNWRKASSQVELDRFRSSAMRHFMQWMANDLDEDHSAAVMFNMAAAEYVKGRISEGLTRKTTNCKCLLCQESGQSKEYSLTATGTTLSGNLRREPR